MQRDLATVGFIFILDMKDVAYRFLLSQQLVFSCKIHSVPLKYSLYCVAVDFASHIITFPNTCWTPVEAYKPLSMKQKIRKDSLVVIYLTVSLRLKNLVLIHYMPVC